MDRTMFSGRETSRIGFGCGRLSGGASAKASARIIEQARALDITHFDVAPSYGLGLAEDVLGNTLAGDRAVTIATKAGISRPANGELKSIAREVLRPLLSAAPGLRRKLGAKAGAGTRGHFDPEQIEASLAESLRRLRRDRVDALLLHQPAPSDVTPSVVAMMDTVVRSGRVGAIGSGTDGDLDALVPFGNVRQYRWYPSAIPSEPGVDIVHGMIRHHHRPTSSPQFDAAMSALGFDPADPAGWPGLLLTLALASLPRAIVLISSTDASRLRASVEAIDWAAARGGRPDFVEEAGALLLSGGKPGFFQSGGFKRSP